MDGIVYQGGALQPEELILLQAVEEQLPILADISRADVLLYGYSSPQKAVVLAHVHPHSIAPVHALSLQGQEVEPGKAPRVFRALLHGRSVRGSEGLIAEGAPIVQEVYPVVSPRNGSPIAALVIETNLIESERLQRRSPVFRKALRQLQEMVLRGSLNGTENLSPFGEHDGILVVDPQKRIRYISGIATNLFRKLGYVDNLVSRHLTDLETGDDELVSLVMRTQRCMEAEATNRNRVWIRKGIPILAQPGGLRALRHLLRLPAPQPHLVGVMLTVHDDTERRREEQELRIKSAMIQEIHHRVKNNLQTVAALLRMQARRIEGGAARQALEESINRVLSVAVIHEFLSRHEARVINIKDVSQRIITQMQEWVRDTEKQIRLELHGPNVYLSTRQATACALVINELLQNALEHGYERKTGGTISVVLEDNGDQVSVIINDDGGGLPAGFTLEGADSLGLQIVQTLVSEDLKGHFELRNGGGVSAAVVFPKSTLGGEQDWSERG
jgi:two-component sensor histidine kinase